MQSSSLRSEAASAFARQEPVSNNNGIVIRRETLATCLDEAKTHIEAHWRELARNRGEIGLSPDYPAYHRLEAHGALRVYTIREHGRLIGYAVYIVNTHLHYRYTNFALSDLFWLEPKKRATRSWVQRIIRRAVFWLFPSRLRSASLGARLFAFIEDDLRAAGVRVMHTSFKLAHPAAGRLLKYLGHTPTEAVYAKLLRE